MPGPLIPTTSHKRVIDKKKVEAAIKELGFDPNRIAHLAVSGGAVRIIQTGRFSDEMTSYTYKIVRKEENSAPLAHFSVSEDGSVWQNIGKVGE